MSERESKDSSSHDSSRKTKADIWLEKERESPPHGAPPGRHEPPKSGLCCNRWDRRRRREQVQGARLSLNESAGAMEVLKAEEAEEWTQLEGYYLKQGLALATIARMKKKRSMY